jgi:cytidylate kinase
MVSKSLSESLTGALVRAADYRLQHEKAEQTTTGTAFTITISREPGASGASVGREVGRLLGWPVYDHELLDFIARDMGTQVNVLQLIDEKPVGWLEQAVVDLVSDYKLSHDAYMVHLIATVRTLGAQGKCVIVGRGANFLLPAASTLRVRLIAELHDRVTVIQRTHNLSEKDATRWVERTQHERMQFVKKNFGKDAGEVHYYDLILNSSRFTVAASARLIVDSLYRLRTRLPAGTETTPG